MAIINTGTATNSELAIDTTGAALIRSKKETTAAKSYSDVDDGSQVLGGLQRTLSPEASNDYRLRVGVDTLQLQEKFIGSTINTGQWSQSTATQTITQNGGFINLNAAGTLTSATYAILKSYKHIQCFTSLNSCVEFLFQYSVVPQANQIIEIGCGFSATTVAPTDGFFLRINNNNLSYVLVNNSVETSVVAVSPMITSFLPNVTYHLLTRLNEDNVEFWINDQLQCTISKATANALSTASQSFPILARIYNTGAVSNAQTLKLAEVNITTGDGMLNKPWTHIMSSSGQNSVQFPSNGNASIGQTANYVNSTVPTSGGLSNTSAAYTTLGGQFQFAAVAGAETDYLLFGFQNPVASVANTSKTLVVTDINIGSFNMGAAVATTPTLLQWAVSQGATAVSLATTEAVASKAHRRTTLGVQSFPIGAAIGAVCEPANLQTTFSVPFIVNPGEFFGIILKIPVGTATASEIIRGTVGIIGYWE